jgi:hypothetical protein
LEETHLQSVKYLKRYQKNHEEIHKSKGSPVKVLNLKNKRLSKISTPQQLSARSKMEPMGFKSMDLNGKKISDIQGD